MSDPHRASCQGCGRHRDAVGGISWSGLCRDCALHAVEANLEALDTKQGYNYTRWVRGMARFLEHELLDAGAAGDQTSPGHA
jgi:hypothetical protein